MTSRTILLMEIPEALPTPRFRFWQRVRFGRCDDELTGCIVGIDWVSAYREEPPDWAYRILLDDNNPLKRVEPCPFVWESEIEEVIA